MDRRQAGCSPLSCTAVSPQPQHSGSTAKRGLDWDGNRLTQCWPLGQSPVGAEERIIFLTDNPSSDIAWGVKDEACMTRSMTPADADPLAQLDMARQATGTICHCFEFCPQEKLFASFLRFRRRPVVGAVGVAEGNFRFLLLFLLGNALLAS